VSIYDNGPMTLRQIAERLHLSFARIKQIETKALLKIKKKAFIDNPFF
jgi:DNA-directed RNA polymerase sigma subunit (sigma70/sigma32)